MDWKFCFWFFAVVGICEADTGRSCVILVSLGEVRGNSFHQLPGLVRFSSGGARVERLKSVFPTEQLPSAFSLATGLHPESHGLVANRMVDQGKVFEADRGGSNDPFWWTGAEPLWATAARRRGIKSAVVGFPGADVRGLEPHYFNQSSSLDRRIEIAFKWLAGNSANRKRLLFLGMSIDKPDDAAKEGVLLARTDHYLRVLFEQLGKNGLDGRADVIITGTHGRIDQSKRRKRLCLDKYAKSSDFEVVDRSAGMISLRPAYGKEEAVLFGLNSARPHARTYLRLDIPAPLHYTNNRRIPDLVVLAEPGWSLSATCSGDKADTHPSGRTGYDNRVEDMHTLFVAKGPSFRENASVKNASLLDIYPLVCHLLGIKPWPNNGTLAALQPLLREAQSKGQSITVNRGSEKIEVADSMKTVSTGGRQKTGPYVSVGGVILIILGSIAFAAGLFALKEYFKRQQNTRGRYRLMERSYEPDLTQREQPLLLDESLSYRCPNSIQLSIMSESGGGLSMRDEDEDESPPSTFTI